VRAPRRSGPLTVTHADLGPEHVLVDDTGAPVGIIDFEDARVGDPEMDLLPTYVVGGRPLTHTMWAYRCRGTLHELEYYVRQGLSDRIAGAIADLRDELAASPP